MTKALVVIDIQNDYFPGGNMEVVNSEAAAMKARTLLDAFRNQNKLVVHVQHISTREGATFFLPGTTGAEINELVQPLDGEAVIVKNFPNSFRGTTLEDLLVDRKVTEITFCGMMSHMCIDATVRAAFDKGFACVVADDGCATRKLAHGGVEVASDNVHAAYMAALGAVYAKVIPTNEVVLQLGALSC